jgi:hypothetical protein
LREPDRVLRSGKCRERCCAKADAERARAPAGCSGNHGADARHRDRGDPLFVPYAALPIVGAIDGSQLEARDDRPWTIDLDGAKIAE